MTLHCNKMSVELGLVKGCRSLRSTPCHHGNEDNLMVACGFHWEFICNVGTFCTNLTGNKKSITNAVEIYESPK